MKNSLYHQQSYYHHIICCKFFQAEIYRFKEFASKVEIKAAENAARNEDYDDAPDEFKGIVAYLAKKSLFRPKKVLCCVEMKLITEHNISNRTLLESC